MSLRIVALFVTLAIGKLACIREGYQKSPWCSDERENSGVLVKGEYADGAVVFLVEHAETTWVEGSMRVEDVVGGFVSTEPDAGSFTLELDTPGTKFGEFSVSGEIEWPNMVICDIRWDFAFMIDPTGVQVTLLP